MNHEQREQSWWRGPIGIVTCGFLIVAGFFLLAEHTAHVFGVLPYLLILACPLMHLFMHQGHHHGGHGQGRSNLDNEGEQGE